MFGSQGKRQIGSHIAGKISPLEALYISVICLTIGLIILSLISYPHGFFLGFFAIFWYCVVYSHLKRKSPFAFAPGAIIGAIPPAIGWITAGGYLFHPSNIAMMLFFFVWQVPHFILIH